MDSFELRHLSVLFDFSTVPSASDQNQQIEPNHSRTEGVTWISTYVYRYVVSPGVLISTFGQSCQAFSGVNQSANRTELHTLFALEMRLPVTLSRLLL